MYNCFLEFWNVNTNFNNFYWLLREKLLLSFIPNEQYRILCLKWNRVAIIFPLLQALLVFPPGWGVLCCQDLIWCSSCWTRRTRTTTTCCPSTWWPCGPAGAQPAAAPWSPGPAPRSTLSSRPPLTDPCSRGSRWGCCVSCSKANLLCWVWKRSYRIGLGLIIGITSSAMERWIQIKQCGSKSLGICNSMDLESIGEEACFSLDFSDGFENWYGQMPGLQRNTLTGGKPMQF